MNLKGISIILIIKDDHESLCCALASIDRIDYPRDRFEVIVVDDGSEKGLLQHIEHNYSFDLKTLYIPRSKFSSRSRARNRGAKESQLEYLLFLDGDQIIKPNSLKSYSNYFNYKPKNKVVLGTRRRVKTSQRALLLDADFPAYPLTKFTKLKYENDIRLLLPEFIGKPFRKIAGNWSLFWSCNFCIEKITFEAAGRFDENFFGWGFEDVELGYRLHVMKYDIDIFDNFVWHIPPPKKPNRREQYFDWITNLMYFYKKHQDPRILLQMEFESIYFFNNKTSLPYHPLDVDWIHHFSNFEKKVDYINKNINEITGRPTFGACTSIKYNPKNEQ